MKYHLVSHYIANKTRIRLQIYGHLSIQNLFLPRLNYSFLHGRRQLFPIRRLYVAQRLPKCRSGNVPAQKPACTGSICFVSVLRKAKHGNKFIHFMQGRCFAWYRIIRVSNLCLHRYMQETPKEPIWSGKLLGRNISYIFLFLPRLQTHKSPLICP